MVKSIYVGNLPWSATEEEIRNLFGAFGAISAIKLVEDRETGRPRGFGFVEMEESEAQKAIEALEGTELGGRTLRISEAKPREPRPPRRW